MSSVKTTLRNNVLSIAFQGSLQTKDINAIRTKVLKRLDKSPAKAVIKLDSYEKLDFSFVQLLVALRAYMDNKQIPNSYNLHFTPEDHDLLNRLGVTNIFHTKKENDESISS